MQKTSYIKFFIIILSVFFIFSCAGAPGIRKAPSNDKYKQASAIYLDFEDVLVPADMQIDKKRTVIVSTPGTLSGIITLKGRIERNSLFNFFVNNMQKDNWRMVSRLKSPTMALIVFEKPNKSSVISIRDEMIATYAEIAVAPILKVKNELSGGQIEETLSIETEKDPLEPDLTE